MTPFEQKLKDFAEANQLDILLLRDIIQTTGENSEQIFQVDGQDYYISKATLAKINELRTS